MDAWTGLENTAAVALLVLGVSALLGCLWFIVDSLIDLFCHAPIALKPETFSGGAARTLPAESNAEKSRQPLVQPQQPPASRFSVPPSFSSPAPKGLSADTMDRARLSIVRQGRVQ